MLAAHGQNNGSERTSEFTDDQLGNSSNHLLA